MKTILISCTACGYEKIVDDGVVESTFKKTGLGVKAFFSESARDFVSLPVVADPVVFGKASPESFKNFDTESLALPTDRKIGGQVYFEHKASSRDLIPLEFFKVTSTPECPLCQKGALKIEEV